MNLTGRRSLSETPTNVNWLKEVNLNSSMKLSSETSDLGLIVHAKRLFSLLLNLTGIDTHDLFKVPVMDELFELKANRRNFEMARRHEIKR